MNHLVEQQYIYDNTVPLPIPVYYLSPASSMLQQEVLHVS